MKKIILLSVATLLGLAFAPDSLAQSAMKAKGAGGWGPSAPYAKMYNTQTVETISGEVVSVDKITPVKGMTHGVHLMVKTDKETIPVHLGPAWYIDNQDVTLAEKDQVEVKGSRVTVDGKPALIAAEVKRGDEVLTLRDPKGYPVWSGWRRK